jgi:hypothetical protein
MTIPVRLLLLSRRRGVGAGASVAGGCSNLQNFALVVVSRNKAKKVPVVCVMGVCVLCALADDDENRVRISCAVIIHPSHPSHPQRLFARRVFTYVWNR